MHRRTPLRMGPLRFRDPVPPLDGAQMLTSAAQLRAQKKSARNDCKNLHFRVK